MSEPFVGEIRMFAGNFAPRGWAFCDGQLLAVSQNDALFSLFGTIYGGDGQTTFALPDLRGRIPIHQGQGPGLRERRLGSNGGQENVTPLTVPQLPSHTHSLVAAQAQAETTKAAGGLLARTDHELYRTPEGLTAMNAQAIGNNTGGSQSHSNLQPFLCVHFIVALFGIYPPRQ